MRNENIIKPALVIFTIIIGIQCLSGSLLFAVKLGFTPESISEFYLGAEEKFIRPRTFAGLLETTVPHLAAVGIVVFILGHLAAFFSMTDNRPTLIALCTCFISAVANICTGYIIRFANPGFVYMKLISFSIFELTFAVLILMLIRSFFDRGKKRT